jgi:hypothetical protein
VLLFGCGAVFLGARADAVAVRYWEHPCACGNRYPPEWVCDELCPQEDLPCYESNCRCVAAWDNINHWGGCLYCVPDTPQEVAEITLSNTACCPGDCACSQTSDCAGACAGTCDASWLHPLSETFLVVELTTLTVHELAIRTANTAASVDRGMVQFESEGELAQTLTAHRIVLDATYGDVMISVSDGARIETELTD